MTLINAPNHLIQPASSFAARGALPARFVGVKFGCETKQFYHAGGLIHHVKPAGAERGAGGGARFKIKISARGLLCSQRRKRRTARNHRLGLAPFPNPSQMFFDKSANRQTHLHLINTRLVDVPRGRNQLGTGALFCSEFFIGRRAVFYDKRKVGQRFGVVDNRGTAPSPRDRRKRRLDSWIGPAPPQK